MLGLLHSKDPGACSICDNERKLSTGVCVCVHESRLRLRHRVLLVDVDSVIPNVALMKISTFYKALGFKVDLMCLGISYYPPKRKKVVVDALGYTGVFVSVLYQGNGELVIITNNENVEYGGTGYSITKKLPDEIEAAECDYSIYPDNDTSYGFITRGCIRNCDFCFVPRKEGLVHQVNTIDGIVRHSKVAFLDANVLAWKKHKELLQELVNRNLRCRFVGGLDVRLVDEETAKLLNGLKYIGDYMFAFDRVEQESLITEKMRLLKKHIVSKTWKLKFFLYCSADMDIINDVYYRILWCKRHEVLPYLMRDVNCWTSENSQLYIDLAAWCNQPRIFKTMTFTMFLIKRHPNDPDRVKKGKVLVESLCLAQLVFEGRL